MLIDINICIKLSVSRRKCLGCILWQLCGWQGDYWIISSCNWKVSLIISRSMKEDMVLGGGVFDIILKIHFWYKICTLICIFPWSVNQLFSELLKGNAWKDYLQLYLIQLFKSLNSTIWKHWYHSNFHYHSVKCTLFLQQNRNEQQDVSFYYSHWLELCHSSISEYEWLPFAYFLVFFITYHVKTHWTLPMKIMLIIHTCILKVINPSPCKKMNEFYVNEKADTAW